MIGFCRLMKARFQIRLPWLLTIPKDHLPEKMPLLWILGKLEEFGNRGTP